ncbi:hypothetical protein C8J56DRAFT_361930 [Mycena floridula]|nr:hypothetical protein C8J56DRAFT_361930 [Mycena floridula]
MMESLPRSSRLCPIPVQQLRHQLQLGLLILPCFFAGARVVKSGLSIHFFRLQQYCSSPSLGVEAVACLFFIDEAPSSSMTVITVVGLTIPWLFFSSPHSSLVVYSLSLYEYGWQLSSYNGCCPKSCLTMDMTVDLSYTWSNFQRPKIMTNLSLPKSG